MGLHLMREKNTPERFEQLSIFSELEKLRGEELSSDKLTHLIRELQKLKKRQLRIETEEKCRAAEAEQKRREQEERERQEAHIREVTCMDLPLDWENAFYSDPRTSGVHAGSTSDALVMSLTTLGKVDIEYIAAITGLSYKEVIGALRGCIYQNPDTWDECFYKGWETSDEYLSGNLMRKWKTAKEANAKYDGYFAENVEAIETVLPPAVATKDIYVTLGSPWVPTDVIDDFMEYLLGDWRRHWYHIDDESDFHTKHDEWTGTWEIPFKSRYGHDVKVTRTYGTEKINALHILERTLNMKSVAVTDEVRCPTNASGKKRVVNKEETVLAIEKQQKMIAAFQRWVWKDEKRKERLETIFENNFSCVRRRVFNGSFLNFPTMSPDVQLYPYQKNAVARILFTPDTLLAHDVGSGKTYVMIAAGMELRRIGLSKKNLYVVPNNIVGQWRDIFYSMYPAAKLLIVEPKSFTPSKRGKVLETVRDEDFDGIIMAYSCFEQIPLSQKCYIKQLEIVQAQVKETAKNIGKRTGNLKKQEEKIAKQLAELTATLNSLSGVCFDELGVTRLFVDEAHNYKNVPIKTKNHALGISKGGSKKCVDMLDKVRTVQQNGGGVILATGTPITNSITDAFVLQKYLQNGELTLLDLQNFDSWIGMFAERVTEFEIDVDTMSYRLATRFSKFHNLPELTALFSQIADFHRLDAQNDIPDFDGYSDALISKTPEFADYLRDISARADAVHHGQVMRTTDNMLKITTDGRKAALDLRLVSPTTGFTYQSKVARCAENVAQIYRNTVGTQLVFCDTSTPKAGFNVYDEMKRLLTGMGIPDEEIAYVHDAGTESSRKKLFDRMRKGEIRVLIGSTFKLGLGVNVQDKLIALHHLDVPWRPADMTQREGRILRQGNENPKVEIYRYITEGSFDAYSWQLLETKQRFITGLLSGSYTERDGADIEDTVLNYAEVKALAVGNPLVKKRVETANELSRTLTLQRKLIETRQRMETELRELPALISHQEELIENARKDQDFYGQYISSLPIPVTTAEKNAEAASRAVVRKRLFTVIRENELKTAESNLMEYRGFTIVLPANMKKEKPFVWLQRAGRYYVELGDTEVGGLIRIDNFLENLDAHIEKLCKRLSDLRDKDNQIRAELERRESYTEKIEELKDQLERLDKKLGVDKK